MRFGTDPSQMVLVQWQFCQPTAESLGFPTAFCSRSMENDYIWPDIGEIQYTRQLNTLGVGPSMLPGTGAPCGDPAVWAAGYQGTIPSIYPLNAFGNSLCCAGVVGRADFGALPYIQTLPFVPDRLRPDRMRFMRHRGRSAMMPFRTPAYAAAPAPVSPPFVATRLLPLRRAPRRDRGGGLLTRPPAIVSSAPAYTGPTVVQIAPATSASPGSSLTATLPTPATPGNTVLVFVRTLASTSITVVDNQGNTYFGDAYANYGLPNVFCFRASGIASNGGPLTVTVAPSPVVPDDLAMSLAEVTPGVLLDGGNINAGVSASPTPGPWATGHLNELGVTAIATSGIATSYSVPPGWTIGDATLNYFGWAYIYQITMATLDPPWTLDLSDTWRSLSDFYEV